MVCAEDIENEKQLGLRLLCSKFCLLFFPEFPKNFAHYSFDYSNKILLTINIACRKFWS